MNERYQAIIAAYVSLRTSVDRITVFPNLRSTFLDRIPKQLRAEAEDDAILLWRLVQLRKSSKLPPLPSEN